MISYYNKQVLFYKSSIIIKFKVTGRTTNNLKLDNEYRNCHNEISRTECITAVETCTSGKTNNLHQPNQNETIKIFINVIFYVLLWQTFSNKKLLLHINILN